MENITTDKETMRIGDTTTSYALVFDTDISSAEMFYEVRNSSGEKIDHKTIGNGLDLRDNFTIVREKELCELPLGKHSAYFKLKDEADEIVTFLKIEIKVEPEKVTENGN